MTLSSETSTRPSRTSRTLAPSTSSPYVRRCSRLSELVLIVSTSVQLDDVAKARPEITKTVENMVSQGKWTVPGYTESASTSSLLFPAVLAHLYLRLQSSECVFFYLRNFDPY